jgi:hypothetical protein
MVGHAGHEISLTNILNIPILLLNPWSYGFIYVSVRATPTEHEDHHTFPRSAPQPSCAELIQLQPMQLCGAHGRNTSQQQQLLGHQGLALRRMHKLCHVDTM